MKRGLYLVTLLFLCLVGVTIRPSQAEKLWIFLNTPVIEVPAKSDILGVVDHSATLFSTPSPITSNTTPATPSATTEAVVTRIIDGDTIELETGQKLRYIGIDTPETKHPTKGVECFGKEAAQKNTELVMGKKVRLEKDVNETDRYGRLLRYVWIDNQLINEVLVKNGYAVASSYPPDVARQDQLRAAESQARAENRGLWGLCENK